MSYSQETISVRTTIQFIKFVTRRIQKFLKAFPTSEKFTFSLLSMYLERSSYFLGFLFCLLSQPPTHNLKV